MFLETLTFTLSVKKFPVFYGTDFSLPYYKYLGTDPILKLLNNFTSLLLVSLRSVLILSCFLSFVLLDCTFSCSARIFENLRFKIWNNPGEKCQSINEELYPPFSAVSHQFWNYLCHDCLSLFLNETCVNCSTTFCNLRLNLIRIVVFYTCNRNIYNYFDNKYFNILITEIKNREIIFWK
jgi:hypothetical protein